MDEKKPYEEIAPRLRCLREAMGLSVEELAEKVVTPADKVALYESGEAEIPVSYLFKVSQACGVDLTVLVSGGEAHLRAYTVVKHGGGLSVDRRKDYKYKSLAYRFTGRKMEPFYISVPPKEPEELSYAEHPGQEFIYMLKGRLEIRLGGSIEILEPGDSLYFSPSMPHALRGLDGQDAEFIDVII